MTPAIWLETIHKVVMLLGMCFVVWWIWHTGSNEVKMEDIQSVQKQNKEITRLFTEWQTQDIKAKEAQNAAIKSLNDSITKQREPIIVRVPTAAPSPFTLPGVQASRDAGGPSPARGNNPGSRAYSEEDLRPEFNRIESKYSEALARCRRIIATCKVPR